MYKSIIVYLIVVVGIRVESTFAAGHMSPTEAANLIAKQCGVDSTKCPQYTDSKWIYDSVLTGDLLVRGTPKRHDDIAILHIDEIIDGIVEPRLCITESDLKLILPNRVQWDEQGVWILMRTPHGYFAVNPQCKGLNAKLEKMATAYWLRRPIYEDVDENWGKNQIYHTYQVEPESRKIWHGSNVFVWRDGDVSSELYVEGKEVLKRTWDSKGRLKSLARNVNGVPGAGFALKSHKGRITEWAHWKDGRRTGVRQKFFKDTPDQLREEIMYVNGVREGRSRRFNREGGIERDVEYVGGFIAPIVKPRKIKSNASGQIGASVHVSDFGVSYDAPHSVISRIKIGMSTQEVADILRALVSPEMGVYFGVYQQDEFLAISFTDGFVSAIKTGHNGACVSLRK